MGFGSIDRERLPTRWLIANSKWGMTRWWFDPSKRVWKVLQDSTQHWHQCHC